MTGFGRIFTAMLGAAFGAAVLGGAAQAQAPTPSKLSQHEYWIAYSYKSAGKTACYILSQPIKKEPASVNHGDNYFLISKRSGTAKLSFEPQFMAGYPLKAETNVIASVGDKNFRMFTKGNSAWVDGDKQESDLLTAMRGGKTLDVKAVSVRGTKTAYSYSLKGLTAALKAISKCK